jgi:hypothetical protein
VNDNPGFALIPLVVSVISLVLAAFLAWWTVAPRPIVVSRAIARLRHSGTEWVLEGWLT